MPRIEVLSEETIDKIAAGEVVEKPASIVKELVENAIDANATSITIEIKDGGTSLIRITDNGDGIEKSQVKKAFYRHATSKLRDVEDLETILSLGFRGEALSSICAIANVELMTKTRDELIGTRYIIEGAREIDFSDIGVPQGTTILVRNIFFNVPARRKFLKSATTEAGYITDVCEHMALSRPDIAFKFISGGQLKFNTSGDGDLKEVIYRIYGKDVAMEMIPFSQENKDISLEGYLGKPTLNRSTRNYEKFFVNGRFIKSKVISDAVETGYKAYLMQHKFPFLVLNIKLNTRMIDVNVHPTKMEIKFNNEEYVRDYIETAVFSALKVREMIPEALLTKSEESNIVNEPKVKGPEPFEQVRKYEFAKQEPQQPVPEFVHETCDYEIDFEDDSRPKEIKKFEPPRVANVIKAENTVTVKPVQMDLFEDKLLTKDALSEYRVVGQAFGTYWFLTYRDKLLMLDQHAAHEKVKYEAIMQKLREKKFDSQELNPPMIITLSGLERATLEKYQENFTNLGYEWDDFGGNEIAVRAVPNDLYSMNEREIFMEVLDELVDMGDVNTTPEILNSRIATMACKSAVKGNTEMSEVQLWELLRQLLTLDNPYNCPHGRPTIVTMSQAELDKKFKRIV